MKVIHVIGKLGVGGDSFSVLSTRAELEKMGVEHCFITHEGYNTETVEKLRSEGAEIHILPADAAIMGPVKYYNAIKNILTKPAAQYDAVHVHTALQSGIALMAAKHAGIGKRICHARTNRILRKSGAFKSAVARFIFNNLINLYSTDKLAVSQEAGEFLFGKSQTFTVLFSGVDTGSYACVTEQNVQDLRKEFNIQEKDILVGNVGIFSNAKNLDYVLKLMEVTDERIRYVFVGDGENFNRIKEDAQKFGERAIFTGRRNDVPVFMMMFDCLLLPSLGEGFPRVVLEGQAAGLPCIVSTNVPQDVDLGLGLVHFIDLSDFESWKDEVGTVAEHNSRAERAEYAAKVKNSGCDITDAAKKLFNIYEGM